MLEPGLGNCKDAKLLNRIFTASDKGYSYEADASHAEFIRNLNLQNAKVLSSPGIDGTQKGEEVLLDHDRSKLS